MRRLYIWVLGAVVMSIAMLSGGCFGGMRSVATPSPKIPSSIPALTSRLPSDYRLIDIKTIAPDIVLDMRYATSNNFLKSPVYPVARCLLRGPVAEALKRVQADLAIQGFGLKLFDCYRPLSVQRAMWKILPDSNYVADPAKGSRHNRGAAVDLTLVDATGKELEMPTDFDDFSEKAFPDSPNMTAAARRNVDMLAIAMEKQGYTSISTEWWHFDGPNWRRYGVLNQSL